MIKSRFQKGLGVFVGSCAVLALASSAQAFTVTYSSALPLMETDFTVDVFLPKFNPSFYPGIATLNSITFQVDGKIIVVTQLENKGARKATLTSVADATLTLQRPDTSPLVVNIPSVTQSALLQRYDHVVDYAGTSGITFDPVTQTASDSMTYSDAGDLALFTGTGSINLFMDAAASATVTGSGNYSSQVTTQAGAKVYVTYDISDSSVPEPGTYAFLAAGVLGSMGVVIRRRKK